MSVLVCSLIGFKQHIVVCMYCCDLSVGNYNVSENWTTDSKMLYFN